MQDFLLATASNGLVHAGLSAKLWFLLAMTQLTVLTVTLYLHRGVAHRSLEFHPAVAHFFRFWSWLTTSMVTREWVAIHRKHHAHSESERDPHSPQVHGIRTLLWRGTELYIGARSEPGLLETYGTGTPNDWIERHVYTPHCNWGPTLLLLAEVALFGVIGVAIWAVQMMWIPFWGAGVVNGLGHWCGYRNFETADRSGNLFPIAFWVGGEELHNNHHAFPSSAKFSLRRYEFDIGWLVIRLLSSVGLARVKRVARMHDRQGEWTGARPFPRARLAPRVKVMTGFFREVTLPVLRDEVRGGLAPSSKFRRALADGGRWLDAADRERLNVWICAHPGVGAIQEYRSRLSALMERRQFDAQSRAFSRWFADAERSGIDALRAFATALAVALKSGDQTQAQTQGLHATAPLAPRRAHRRAIRHADASAAWRPS
jgi:stearoyl-CoA desaturase (delta-9 desaturase)